MDDKERVTQALDNLLGKENRRRMEAASRGEKPRGHMAVSRKSLQQPAKGRRGK